MMMSWIWTGLTAISILCAVLMDNGPALSAAVLQGAQAGITVSLSLAGSLCLWSGVGKLMEAGGLTAALSRLLSPLLHLLFPSSKRNPSLAGHISANVCANFLGLGNAATPMGILAAKGLANGSDTANNQLCRLVVLNTASIQLIPGTVAALRGSLGAASPFDILPAVWITSICSAGLGLIAAWVLGKVWKND